MYEIRSNSKEEVAKLENQHDLVLFFYNNSLDVFSKRNRDVDMKLSFMEAGSMWGGASLNCEYYSFIPSCCPMPTTPISFYLRGNNIKLMHLLKHLLNHKYCFIDVCNLT